MADLKSILKTIEKTLPSSTTGIGVDFTDLIDSDILNKEKGDYASAGIGANLSEDKIKPQANLAFKKNDIVGAISAANKNDYGAGLMYKPNDLEEASFNFSKNDRGNTFMLRGTKKFKTGGLLKQGKPKIALRGWK